MHYFTNFFVYCLYLQIQEVSVALLTYRAFANGTSYVPRIYVGRNKLASKEQHDDIVLHAASVLYRFISVLCSVFPWKTRGSHHRCSVKKIPYS